MPTETVSHYLGLLQADPDDPSAVAGLRSAFGDDEDEGSLRLLEAARQGHTGRSEHRAAAWLMELEAELVEERDPELFVALQRELGRVRQEELLDDRGARAAWQAALERSPGDAELEEKIAAIDESEGKWEAIVDRFVGEAQTASDATLRTSLLTRAACLVWQYEPDTDVRDGRVDTLFQQALESDPAATRTARLFAETLRVRSRYEELAEVLYASAEAARNRDDKLQLHLRAARGFARTVQDTDRAASCYERVLDLVPGQDEALTFLVDHFTERAQWDHLVALYEDALRSRQKLEAEEGILLQLGMVHWKIRERPDEAEPFFARVRKLDAGHPGMLEFYRAHLGDDDQPRLLTILSDALRVTKDPDARRTLAVEVARLAQEDASSVERAIDAWKAVQRIDPAHGEAHAALKSLYRRAERWNALVEVMKAEIDSLEEGPDGDARRVEILREMVPIYRDHLQLDVMVIQTYKSVLELAPDDAEAIDALAVTYESMGRWNDLIQVLGRKAEAASDDAEKVALYTRIADLWIERFANYNQATQPLERVIAIDPDHREALAQLKDIYAKKRSWKSLFDVMERESRLASDPSARRELRIELARLAGDRLHRHDEAIRLWKGVLEEDPEVPGALDALEKLAEREKDWGTLADSLERRLERTDDGAARVRILQKLGAVYGDQLDDPVRAAGAWKRVLEVDPKNARALRTLRESFVAAEDWDGLEALYAEAADWEGLVDVYGSAAEKAASPATKVELSFRAAAIYEGPIGEPHRAFRNYERVLSVDPENLRAARALVPIYERDEKWSRLVGLHEILLDAIPDGEDVAERVRILGELRRLCLDELGNEARAFDFAARAYALDPEDPEIVEALEASAGAASAHARLADLYLERLDAIVGDDDPGDEELRLRRRVATLASDELGRADQAIGQLERIVEVTPEDAEAVQALDRLYREQGRLEPLRALYLRRIEHAPHDGERHALLNELARFEEDDLDDAAGAAGRYRAILEIEPEDDEALVALDRLAVDGERWEELADVLDRRRALSVDAGERQALTLRLARLQRERLAAPEEALARYAEVLADDPMQEDAIRGLEALAVDDAQALEATRHLEAAYEALGDDARLAAVLRRRLDLVDDPEEVRGLRLRVADLATDRLGDASVAYGMLEAAFVDGPDDLDLAERLGAAAERAGAWLPLAKALTRAIESDAVPGGDAAVLAARVADVYDRRLRAPRDAEPFHRRVLQEDPLADRAFDALRDLYTTEERWDDLQKLYRNRIAHTVDATEKREHLLQVCFLFEEMLDEPDLAIRAHEEVLELDPTHSPSRRALRRLYQRTERWRDLVALLEAELGDATGQDEVDLTFELGELHERRLDEPGVAVDRYEAVLVDQPTHLRAQEALERLLEDPTQRQRIAATLEPLYTSQGAWGELVKVLEVQLEDTTDPGTRVGLLVRIAEACETKLRDPAKAFTSLSAAVETDPADAHVRGELARLARVRGAQRERAEVLERAIDAAGASGHLQAEIQRELARLWGEAVGDVDRAEAAWGRLVEIDGDDPESVVPASRALAEIHEAREDWRGLAEDLRRLVDTVQDPDERAALLVRLAALQEERLEDLDAAVETHRERLDLDPSDADALLALERLHETRGEWQRLVGVLQSRDEVTTDEAAQRAIAARIGEVYETRLGDVDSAIVAYDELVRRFGPDADALGALERLYERRESWQDLLETLQSHLEIEDRDDARAALLARVADLQRTETGELEAAIEGYAEVLSLAPGNAGAVEGLEALLRDEDPGARIAAGRVLVPRIADRGEPERLVEALEVLAESDDPAERLDALRRGAEVAATDLEDPQRAFDFAGRAVRAGVAEPDLGAMLDALDARADETGRHLDEARLLKEIAPDVMDGDLQIRVLLRVAELARERLEDPALARDYYYRVLDVRPDHGRALDRLEALFEDRNDPAGLLEVLERKTELASEPEQRVWMLLRQAELAEGQLGDVERAIDALERVLDEGPRLEAFVALERLYRRASRWDDLRGLFERQLDVGVGETTRVHHALGELHRRELEDPEGALAHYEAALRAGDHPGTVDALAEMMEQGGGTAARAAELAEHVYLARMDWPRVVHALETRLAAEDDVVERAALLRRLGEVHEDHLEDLDGALESYARLFREEPTVEETWETLLRLARVLDRWPRLVEVAVEALDGIPVDDDASAALAHRAAKVADQRLGDLDRAAALHGRALRFDPTDGAVFAALESVLRRKADWTGLLALYRDQLDVAVDDEARIRLLHATAGVLEDELGDPEGAVGVLREVLEVDPGELRANEALDRLLTALERWPDLADHLRHRIDGALGAPEEIPLRHRLAELLATRLDDVEGAVDVFEEILALEPHPPTVESLERLVLGESHRLRITRVLEPVYRAADQWKKLVVIFDAQQKLTEEPAERARLLGEIGRLHETRGRDPELAFDAWARAFAADPLDPEARAEVDRLAEVLGVWDRHVRAYERAVDGCEDPAVVTELLTTLARTHEARRDDPQAAIAAYERLLAHEPDDASPLDALEGLHTLVGDWAGLVHVLERKVERAYDPEERGDLLRRVGSVQEELLADRDAAVASYRRALEEDPVDGVALASLDRLYAATSRWGELAETLERRIEIADDGTARAELGLRLGRLRETELGDAVGATDALVAVLEEEPTNDEAILRLEALYERRGLWNELLDNLRLQAGLAGGIDDQARLLHRAGEILERRLDDVPAAIDQYAEVLGLAPRHEPTVAALLRVAALEEHRDAAAEVLEPLLEADARWGDLAGLVEAKAEAASDPFDRRALFRRLAEIRERGLGDAQGAFDAYRRALAEADSEADLADAVERLGADLGAWGDVADALRDRSRAAMDPEEALGFLGRHARVAEARLGDVDRALEAWRRGLELVGDRDEVLAELDRILSAADRPGELVDVLERRVPVADDAEARAGLWLRVGALRRGPLGDAAGAFAAYREVLTEVPGQDDAVAGVEGLLGDDALAPDAVEVLDAVFRDAGSLDRVAGLYDHRLRLAADDGERVRLLGDLAVLREQDLGDPAGALDAWRRAFALDPTDPAPLDEAERLAGETDGFEALRGVVEAAVDGPALDADLRRDLLRRAAGWYRERLGDLSAAERALRDALAADPSSLDAHAELAALLRGQGRGADLVDALVAWSEAEPDPPTRVERLREAAVLARDDVGDPARASQCLDAVLAIDPEDSGALAELAVLRQGEGRIDEAVSLLRRLVEVEADPDTRVDLRRRLAETLETAGDPGGAREAWAAVLDEDPGDERAFEALAAAHEVAGDWAALRALLERRIDAVVDEPARVAARRRLAAVAEAHLDDRDAAVEQLREILLASPGDPTTVAELERLLREAARWEDLVDLLDAEAGDAAARGDVDRARPLLVRLADVQEARLGDPAAAVAAWERVVDLAPGEPESLAALVRLHEAGDDPEALASALDRLAVVAPDDEAIPLLDRLATLSLERLDDALRAEEALRQAAVRDASGASTRRLEAHLEAHGRWAELAELLGGEVDAAPDAEARVALLRRMAALYADRVDDPVAAAACLERAVTLAPDDRELVVELAERYVRSGRAADAVPVLERVIEGFGGRRVREVARFQHQLGRARESLGDAAGALEAYDAAFRVDLTSVPVLRDLGRLCYTEGDLDRASKTFRALLLQKLGDDAGIRKADVYFYLGNISARQGDTVKARHMLERAVAEDGGHADAERLLETLAD